MIGSRVWVCRVGSGGIQLVTRRWPVAAAKQAGEQMVVWCTTRAAEYVQPPFLLLLLLHSHNWLQTNPGQLATSQASIGKQENISLGAAQSNHVPPPSPPVASPLWASEGKRPPLQSARCCYCSAALPQLSTACCCCSGCRTAAALAGLGRTIRPPFGADNSNRGQQTRPGKPGSSLCIEQLLLWER